MIDEWRERFRAALPDQAHLTTGEESNFDFSVQAIQLAGGATVQLQHSGVTAIVGANNAGKSTLLREIWTKLNQQPGFPEQPCIAVDSLQIETQGSEADVIAWLGSNSSFVVQGTSAGFQRSQTGIQRPNQLLAAWNKRPIIAVGNLATSIAFYGDAQGRFNIGGAVEMRENVDDPPQHPVHYLQDSRELLDRLSEVTQEVFGVPLTLDSLGRTLRLRIGEVKIEAPPVDNVTSEYREQMSSLRPLDEQGDGMRSMLGQLLPVITAAYKLILLDEPEAFLHPPQAHALGIQLGRIAVSQGIQIVLATHDRNLLTGLLDSGVEVSVVRLSRANDGPAQTSRLDSDQLRTLWTDPVLKYTNTLDGLFHRLVVVAEAEGDCAYLAAAMDYEGRTSDSLPRNEVLLVPTGGKDGMAKVCAALNAVRVPVVAAPDLDMLSDKNKVKSLVEALGGEWSSELDRLWSISTADLNAPREPVTVAGVSDAISAVLTPHRSEHFTSMHRTLAIGQLRTSSSPWAAVKDHGLSAFKGDARQAIGKLVRLLDSHGVVLVQEGELERLAPEVNVRKGPGWLQAALSAGEQDNAATQSHIDRILAAGATRAAGYLSSQ